jgi:hypothetical protein
VDGAREKARVLDEERVVDAELLPCDLELVLGRVLVRDEEARRVVRDLEQDHERHEGHRDDEHSRPDDAADDVGDHGRLPCHPPHRSRSRRLGVVLLYGFVLLAGFAFLLGRLFGFATTALDHVLGSACGRTHGGSCSGAFGSRPQDRLAITVALFLRLVLPAFVLWFFGHRDPLLS